ncbi:thiol:disulfide interchange protein DsbC [Novosphingobium kunmingense]|uniref:Thiol:disulfide interchange protein n=1 Tax=Novosphingobium kunmingense TaxID=1211806 RepID=A0A2N0H3M7_9SPHN|nr:DsbC family protein [Novosphingobium kunmingense]PKB13545.1 thiol:disulfide interchange protein DsbC [Novosphingobium kunmingense]
MKLTSLKSFKLARPRLGQVLMPLAAIALGSGGSLVWANAGAGDAATAQHVPSEADQAVTALLKQRLPRTQVSRVNCQVVDGVCEVTAGSQLFYVDKTARYLLIGRVYDMQTRQDLTAVRLLEVNPDLLVGGAAGSKQEAQEVETPRRGVSTPTASGAPRMMSLAALPEAGGIVWGASSGPTVTVFSDFRCGYCRALSGVLENMNVRVIERPISVLGSRDLANQVFCARDRRKAVKAAYAGAPITDTRACDTSPLDANEAFARQQGLAGTPVIVRSDGAVIEGFRPREVLEQWLKGAKS